MDNFFVIAKLLNKQNPFSQIKLCDTDEFYQKNINHV